MLSYAGIQGSGPGLLQILHGRGREAEIEGGDQKGVYRFSRGELAMRFDETCERIAGIAALDGANSTMGY